MPRCTSVGSRVSVVTPSGLPSVHCVRGLGSDALHVSYREEKVMYIATYKVMFGYAVVTCYDDLFVGLKLGDDESPVHTRAFLRGRWHCSFAREGIVRIASDRTGVGYHELIVSLG